MLVQPEDSPEPPLLPAGPPALVAALSLAWHQHLELPGGVGGGCVA